MQIRHYEAFVQSYESNSFSLAAERMFTSQPTVSRLIRELEDQFQVSLFERSGNRLIPTQAAHRLYSAASVFLNDYRNLEHSFATAADDSALYLGTSEVFGTTLALQAVNRLKSASSQADVVLRVDQEPNLIRELSENRLDFAVLFNRPDSFEEYIIEDYAEVQLVLLLPPAPSPYGIVAKDLNAMNGLPFLHAGADSDIRRWVEHALRRLNVQVKPVMESAGLSDILQAVHHGLGISILPEPFLSPEMKAGWVTAVPLPPDAVRRRSYLVQKKDYVSKPFLADLIQACRDVLAQ